MKKIYLSGKNKNKFTLVDDSDYCCLKKYRWYLHTNGYAVANIQGKHMRLHRLILHAPPHLQVDHINGARLDNRRNNLRLCTSTENNRNQRLKPSNTSGYKGVYWSRHHNKWRASIRIDYHNKSLGYFDTAKKAGEAYKRAALRFYGEFARFE